jgi:hypothetical protein
VDKNAREGAHFCETDEMATVLFDSLHPADASQQPKSMCNGTLSDSSHSVAFIPRICNLFLSFVRVHPVLQE